MAQVTAIIDTLKTLIKAQGLTYREVADALSLSEASIKRLFSLKRFSLQQLEQVCQLLGMEISDVIQHMSERQSSLQQLTEAQEQEIASDLPLLLITVSVLNRWTLPDLLRHYAFTEPQCIQHLAKLDRLQIIELLPKNRIRLKVAPNFRWRAQGPIEHFFKATIEQELFGANFAKENQQLLVLNGMLSSASNAELQKQMQRLAQSFDRLNNEDAGLPIEQKQGATLVLALRDWQYRAFERWRR